MYILYYLALSEQSGKNVKGWKVNTICTDD